MTEARTLAGPALAQALRDSRARTHALTADLSDARWQVPQRAGLNPIAWELAHLAWFAEFWVLRGPHRVDAEGRVQAAEPPRHAGPDALLDSSRLPHAQRWTAPLPARAQLIEMLDAQLAACLAALPQAEPADGDNDDAALYFHRLALFHEDMHGEALTWLRASLGYPAPPGAELPNQAPRSALFVPGGEVLIGRPASEPGFAFDNESPQQALRLGDFEIDSAPLSAGQYLRFVEAGGYDEPAFWPGAAGRWRAAISSRHPERWRRGGAGWEQRWFERWLPLHAEQPLVHVNAWEAEAYCRWAGRRLPSAAEWEHAALLQGGPGNGPGPGPGPASGSSPGSSGSGPGRATADRAVPTAAAGRFVWGSSVWEWTADSFAPYPGFAPGPYRDYSAPWFGDHRELRGGAFATPQRLHDARLRNFFLPQRTDVFAGFRTAALQA